MLRVNYFAVSRIIGVQTLLLLCVLGECHAQDSSMMFEFFGTVMRSAIVENARAEWRRLPQMNSLV
jgi:hypothetical protein